MITIISGDIDSGKTRYLKEHYKQESKGDGFISLKHFKEGNCIGYDLHHLKSGETVALIRLKSVLPGDWDACSEIGRFSFSEKGMLLAKSMPRPENENLPISQISSQSSANRSFSRMNALLFPV